MIFKKKWAYFIEIQNQSLDIMSDHGVYRFLGIFD